MVREKILRLIVVCLAVFTGVVAGPAAAQQPAATPLADAGATADQRLRALQLNPEVVDVVAMIPNTMLPSALLRVVKPDVAVFEPDPTRPSRYAQVDTFGTFTLFTGEQGEGLPAPFTPFAPADRASNDKLVTAAAWTPDGSTLAIVVDNPERLEASEGIYVWEPGVTGANQIFHNCRPGAANCLFFVSAQGEPANWYARSLSWSPDGEQLLARVWMSNVERDGFVVLTRTSDRTQRGPICPYQYSAWTPDGKQLVVSGRGETGAAVLGLMTTGTCSEVAFARVSGSMWLQHGVADTNGTLFALGRASYDAGPVHIVDGEGSVLTEPIGATSPSEVQWNPTADAVFVRTEDGRSYIASVSGQVIDVTEFFGEGVHVAWIALAG